MARRVSVVLFVVCLGAIAWTGCAFVSRTPCTSNDECRSGLLCVDDICVAPEAYKPYQLAGALGTQACEEPTPQGAAGIRTIRFALKRDHAQLQPILGRNGLQLTTKQLSIDGPIRVSDQDGNDVSNSVSVSITMAQDNAAIPFHLHPRYQELRTQIPKKRIPRAISLTIDMSATAAKSDPERLRILGPINWISQALNGDSSLAELDLFSVTLARNDTVSLADLLFKTWETDLQYIAADGTTRGFIHTVEDDKIKAQTILKKFSNDGTEGTPPVYSNVHATAINLRVVARTPDTKQMRYLPGLFAILTERDTHLIHPIKPMRHEDAHQALKGTRANDSIPFFPILFPKPKHTSDADWKTYTNQLCQLTQATGNSNKGGWGQLIPITPGQTNALQKMQTALDFATISMFGFFETKLNYTITGGTKGHTYWISVPLNITHPLLANPKKTTQGNIVFSVRY